MGSICVVLSGGFACQVLAYVYSYLPINLIFGPRAQQVIYQESFEQDSFRMVSRFVPSSTLSPSLNIPVIDFHTRRPSQRIPPTKGSIQRKGHG